MAGYHLRIEIYIYIYQKKPKLQNVNYVTQVQSSVYSLLYLNPAVYTHHMLLMLNLCNHVLKHIFKLKVYFSVLGVFTVIVCWALSTANMPVAYSILNTVPEGILCEH